MSRIPDTLAISATKISKDVKSTTMIKNNFIAINHMGHSNHNPYIKNIMYLDTSDICYEKIKIKIGQYLHDHNIQFYNIMYHYNNISHDRLEKSLNILCKDLTLCQKRYGAYVCGGDTCTSTCNLPLVIEDESFQFLECIIRMIRSVIIDHILAQNIPMMNHEHAENLRGKRVYLEMMRKGKLCKIVKLGSRTENHVNTEIQSIGEFNNLLKDYRHNKINTSSCYKANVVVSFRCSVYRKENKKYIIDKEGNPKIDPHSMMISFAPYLKLVEMRYNRAVCAPMINTDNKVVALDNVLVL
jgi:hypothetical protein